MGCYNYSNGLFEIQVKLPKNWVLITHLFFQCAYVTGAVNINHVSANDTEPYPHHPYGNN